MNFQITQGSGTTIGSDSVAAVNFQQIKLMDATIGSAAGTGIAANPLKVSLEFTNSNTNPLLINGTIIPAPPSDRPTTGLMAGALDTVVIDCTGISTLGWTTSGNWIGTMVHEVQYGDGQWFIVETIDTNLANDGQPFVVTSWTEALNNDPWITNVAGATQLRFRFTAYTSGSANIITNGSAGINAVRVYNTNPASLQTTSLIRDSANNALTSTANALDVNLKTSSITLSVSGSGDFTVVQPTGTNLHTVVDSGSITVANATLAVTQSGVWTTGRTWTLASGTDSIAAVQSGTWNINDISGTISLPTGAATEATLSTRLADATFTARVNTLGQKTMANSTPVVLASDQTVIPVSQSGTWTVQQGTPPWSQNLTQIAGSAISTAASGIARVGLTDGTGNAITSTANALDTNVKSWLGSTAPTVGQKAMASAVPVVLASDQSFTYPTAWHISQRVVNNQVFSVSTELNMATGAADNPAILLRNPNGSGKTMYLRRVTYGTPINNVAVTAKVFATPTITANGTTITPANRNVGSGTASVILATTLPTISVLGTELATRVAAQNTAPLELLNDFEIAVAPNQTVLITGQPNSNNRAVGFTVLWVEI